LIDFGCLTPLSAIFQLYHGDQFLVVEEAGVPEENLEEGFILSGLSDIL
jgi:hypothetical protein